MATSAPPLDIKNLILFLKDCSMLDKDKPLWIV